MKLCKLASAILIWLLLSCNNRLKNEQADVLARETVIRANLNDIVEYCWNRRDTAKFRIISTENFVRNVNDITAANNRNEMEAAMNIFFTAFPDLHLTIDDTVIKDSLVFTHWTATGTNTGIFGDAPATGKKVKFTGYTVGSFTNEGKFLGEDVYFNELSFLQQMGYTLSPPVLK